jgi:hypothetical protein
VPADDRRKGTKVYSFSASGYRFARPLPKRIYFPYLIHGLNRIKKDPNGKKARLPSGAYQRLLAALPDKTGIQLQRLAQYKHCGRTTPAAIAIHAVVIGLAALKLGLAEQNIA